MSPLDDSTRRGRWVEALVAFMFASGIPASTWAQTSEAAGETTLPGGTLVVISYAALWFGLLAFVGYLGWCQRALNEEVDDLEDRLDALLERAADAPEES